MAEVLYVPKYKRQRNVFPLLDVVADAVCYFLHISNFHFSLLLQLCKKNFTSSNTLARLSAGLFSAASLALNSCGPRNMNEAL